MVIQFLIIFKYLKLAILSLDSDFFPLLHIPKTDGYYRNLIPDLTLVWTCGGGVLVHSLAVSTISMGFTCGKRTPYHEVHCTQAQILDFPSFDFQSVKQFVSKFYLFIYLVWCGGTGRRMWLKEGAQEVHSSSQSGTIAGTLLK
jgi:hypothetical protein